MNPVESRPHSPVAVDYDPFADAPLARAVPATEPQREIWLASSLEPAASLAYNESVSLRFGGALDEDALVRALQALVDRHEALRATFGADGSDVLIAEHVELVVERRDLSVLDAASREAEVERTLRRVVETPFDLEKGPLLRAELLRLGAQDHLLVLTAHHIVCDGWSWGVLVDELAAICRAGTAAALPPADSFGDYAIAQAAADSDARRADEAYWLSRFAGSVPVLDLPTDRPRPRRRSFASAREDRTLDVAIVGAAKAAGAKRRASLYAVLLATFGALLQRIAGEDDVVIGIPAAGQAAAGHTRLVGHAVNVLPLRAAIDPAAPFADLLETVRKDLLDAFEHRQYTIGTLLKRLAIPRDAGRLPLCSVLFNLDQALDESTVQWPGLSLAFNGNPRAFENFELFVNAVQTNGALRLECQYNSDLFDAATVRAWLDAYETLLRAAVADASVPVARLDLVSPAARERLERLQPPAVAFDATANAAGAFFAQAAREPARSALACGATNWTYGELAARAGAIAAALQARGVGRGALVGLCLERGADMVAGVMGMLAAGAGYVPLDPAFPRERLDFMSRDAGLALLLTQDALAATIDWPRERTLAIEALTEPAQAPQVLVGGGEDVAYVIYTSGSTGKPKGVRVPHRGVVNFLASMRKAPGLDADDRLVAVTTLSFDIAVLELYLPLAVGAQIVLATREQTLDGHALAQLVADSGASVMQATPSTWRLLLEAGWEGSRDLKILCGGEALPPDLAARLIERSASLWNMYGPTETTVWSTCERVERGDDIAIGRPIDNTQVWIVDAAGQLCPPGAPGEILIAGAGVTLGYLDRPELTAERFIADTFGGAAAARAYRTGDRGRWRGDGRLEHLGRFDFQVKLRGFRIELGEIENVLTAAPDVAQAVAIVREDRPADQRLVAYVVPRPGATLDEAALRKHLRATLPEYMVPQHFVALAAVPLLPNGKIDRKALPAPFAAVADADVKPPAVAPRDDVERRVAAAMEATLALPGLCVHDDFFALGGHSLLAAQLTARLNREFGAALSLRALFDAPTIAGLADLLRDIDPSAAGARRIEPHRGQRTAPLSLLQKRIWLFEQLQPGSVVYNVPSAHRLHGELDEQAFGQAFRALVERQAALRTSIEYAGEDVVQRIHDEVPVALFPAEDLSHLPADERERALARELDALTNTPFDLSLSPLFRARMFRLGAQEHALFFMAHHIVWDGWSFDLFYEEFSELYAAQREKRAARLAPLPVSYADFSEWHGRWMAGPEHAAQFRRKLDGWRERLATRGTPAALPTDLPRKQGLTNAARAETEWMRLPADLAERLRAVGREADATVFMVLLAAYFASIWRLAGDGNLVVGTPVRVRASEDVEKIMGLFTSLLPLALDVEPSMRFVDFVGAVRKTMLDGLADPDVQLEDLLHEPGLRELAGNAAFYQAQFSYQDARQRVCDWGGLKQEQILIFQRASSEDFSLWFLEHGTGMTGGLLYNADLFTPQTAQRFARHYLAALERVVADPSQSIADLTRADAGEIERIAQWRRPLDASAGQRIDVAVEAAVARCADRDALTSGSWGTSYAEIGRRARRIGHCLARRGAARGTTVGLCAAPGANRVAAMLGILRLGATCALLDPRDDAGALGRAAAALGATMLVGESRVAEALQWPREKALWLDADGSEIANAVAGDAAAEFGDDAIAFVSAVDEGDGAPRRVAFTHREAMALVGELRDALGIDDTFAIVAAAPPASSLAWLETLLAVACGGVLVEAGDAARGDGKALADLVAVRPHAVLFAPGALWRALLDAGWSGGAGVKAVSINGDLSNDLAAALLERCAEVWNAFGAEPMPVATLRRVASGASKINAGRPVAGADIALRDVSGAVAPIGAVATIHLRGMPTQRRGRWLEDGSVEVFAARSRGVAPQTPPAAAAAPATAAEMTLAERWLAAIWQDMLCAPEVGADENFFDLGGHSLLAMTMVARVEKLTGVRLSLLKIANGTLRALAAELPPDPAAAAASQEAPASLGKRLRGLFGFGKREGGE